MSSIAIGSRVEFREDTAQYDANKGIVYLVEASPSGATHSIDRTHGDDRVYVWLVNAADMDKAPSRRRRRTGYVASLRVV